MTTRTVATQLEITAQWLEGYSRYFAALKQFGRAEDFSHAAKECRVAKDCAAMVKREGK